MNEQPYFHWDILRQPIQPPNFGMGASFFDVNSILELRKEKSRDAARSRRGKENYEFYELAKLLPLPAAITSQLDKASIIRLSISYLRLRDFSGHGDPPWNRDSHLHAKNLKGNPGRRRNHPSITGDMYQAHQGTHILQSLDGFAFILGNDGRFLYISETVSIYLGLSQVEMAGSSIFDYVHQQDHSQLASHLGLAVPQGSSSGVPSPGSCDEDSQPSQRCATPPGPDGRGYVMKPDPKQGNHRSFCLRMKSTLTKRGVHVKSSGYRVVHVLGYMRPPMTMGLSGKGGGNGAPMGMVGLAIALPPPTITELRLEHDTFITRMTPDFSLTYCEPLIAEQMDLSPDDVTNRSLYDLCHAGDLANLRQAHLHVLEKGQVITDYYRLLTRSGGYVWIQTCATTLLNGKNAEDQNILAINYVLSGVEHGHCVMNLWQMCGRDNPTPSSNTSATLFSCGRVQSDAASEEEEGRSSSAPDARAASDQFNSKGDGAMTTNHTGPLSPPAHPSHSLHPNIDADNDVMSDDSADTGTGGGEGGGCADKSEGAMMQDCKNSRRKMERPRKRKREEMENEEGEIEAAQVPGSPPPPRVDGVTRGEQPAGGEEVEMGTSGRPLSRDAPRAVSSPEDLSLRSAAASALDGLPKLPSTQQTLSSPGGLHSSDRDAPAGLTVPWQGGVSVTGSAGVGGSCANVITTSAVKELEAVMNRHLPFLESNHHNHHHHNHIHPDSTPPVRLHDPHSRVSNGSLNNTFPAHAAKKSTIQWAGSQTSTPSSSADAMAASTFLRSLYESRESVIRSCNSLTTASSSSNNNNSHQHNMNSSAGVLGEGTAHRNNQLYEDLAATMITPPGAEVFKDHPPPFSIPSIVISSASPYPSSSSLSSSSSTAKQIPSYGSQMSRGYPGSALSLSMPCGGGVGEAYGMTPPSSVSPQDKLSSPFAAALSYSDPAHNSCSLGRPSMPPPHSASSSSLMAKDSGLAFHVGAGGHSSDYASAKAAYYAMSALSGGHPGQAGYADVNHNTTAAYDQCARPVIPWY